VQSFLHIGRIMWIRCTRSWTVVTTWYFVLYSYTTSHIFNHLLPTRFIYVLFYTRFVYV